MSGADQTRILRFCPETVPPALRRLPGWVVTGADKIPHRPTTRRRADPTDPATGGTFAEAVAAAGRPGFDRVGIILDPATRLVALDFDACVDPATGAVDPAVLAELAALDTYAEYSPSRTGVRAFAYGALPPGARKRGSREAYDRDRYVSVTGWALPGYDVIHERTDELAAWHAETFPRTPAATPRPIVPLALDDEEVLERARRSPRFAALYDRGDLGDYPGADGKPDHSSADLAELNHLIRAGAGRPDQLDRLHRRGALYRDKWDQRRGTATYGERTIARALDGTVSPEPRLVPVERLAANGSREMPPNGPNEQVAGSVDDAEEASDGLPDDPVALKRIIVEERRRTETRLAATETRIARLEEENVRLRDANRRLSLLQSKTMGAFRSKNLGAEKFTGIALAFELANQQAAQPDQAEYVIPYKRLADQAGLSESTVAAHVKERLDPLGMWDRRVRFTPERVDMETGECFPAKTQTVFVPKIDPLAMLDTIATAPHASGKAKNGHGGTRLACRDHPDAGTVKRVRVHCAECDRLLVQEPDAYRPSTDGPNEQVAQSPDTNAPDPDPPRPTPSVVNRRAPDAPGCHNDAPDPGPNRTLLRVPPRSRPDTYDGLTPAQLCRRPL